MTTETPGLQLAKGLVAMATSLQLIEREDFGAATDDDLVTDFQMLQELQELIAKRLAWVEMEGGNRTNDWGHALEGDTARLYRESKTEHVYDADAIEDAVGDLFTPLEAYRVFVPQPPKFRISEAKKIAKRSPDLAAILEAHHSEGVKPGKVVAEFKEPTA